MRRKNDLQDVELRQLAQQVIPRGAKEPFGSYLFLGIDPGAELGRHLERTVFLEAFGNTPELLAQEYDPYEGATVFICVVDHMRRLPAGAMRVLLPSSAGFKSLNDLEPVWGEPAKKMINRTGLSLDPLRTWDVATLAVDAKYRSKATMGLVSAGLYQTLTMAAWHCGMDWFVAILDMPIFRLIRWKLQMVFAGYDGVAPLPYLGSAASIPAWCHISEGKEHLAEVDPALHDILFEGVGLEPAIRTVDLSCTERLGLVA